MVHSLTRSSSPCFLFFSPFSALSFFDLALFRMATNPTLRTPKFGRGIAPPGRPKVKSDCEVAGYEDAKRLSEDFR